MPLCFKLKVLLYVILCYSEVFYVVAPACVGYGLRGWYPGESIERTDRMPVIWAW
jgi:hypothetical protein